MKLLKFPNTAEETCRQSGATLNRVIDLLNYLNIQKSDATKELRAQLQEFIYSYKILST